jgi:hypothetical protein
MNGKIGGEENEILYSQYLDFLDNAGRSIMDAKADVDGRSLSVPLAIKSNFNLESTFAQ